MIKWIALIVISIQISSFSKDNGFGKVLNEVNELYELSLKIDSYEKRDSICSILDSTIQHLFQMEEFCEYSFDTTKHIKSKSNNGRLEGKYLAYSFMNNIKVTSSENNKMRIFSWDNLGGGSFHTYTNYIQIQKKGHSCYVVPLDTAKNSTEVGYYKIIDFKCNDRTFYIVFGYGTYGGGKHHYSTRLFEINEDGLKELNGFYPNGKDLVIYSNRSQESEIEFDKKNNQLSYKQFEYDENTGFYKDGFKEVVLKIEFCE